MKRKKVWLLGGGLVIILVVTLVRARMTPAQKGGQPRAEAMNFVFDQGEQAWLGVELRDVTAQNAREFKLPGEYGAIVQGVEKDSPAEKAGVQEKDVILEYNGQRVWSVAELRRLIRETPPGRTVTLQISRAGQTRALSAALERHEEHFLGAVMPRIEIPEVKIPDGLFHFGLAGTRLGISADELTPQLAEYFGVKQGHGVLVREVNSGSPAAKAGLKAGDCIVKADSTEVRSVDDLHQALVNSGEAREVTLTIVRDRREQTLKVQLEKPRHRSPEDVAEEAELDPGELDEMAAELRALKPSTQELEQLRREIELETQRARQQAAETAKQAVEAQKLWRQLEKQGSDLQKEWQGRAAEIERQVQGLQQELRDRHLGEKLQQELKAQMRELEKELQKLRDLPYTIV